tara:strand:- start:38 stop:397 length:360 start_codon:yes stop_codon:yes gene_type:complete
MKHKTETQLKNGMWVLEAEKLPQTLRNYRDAAIKKYTKASVYGLSIQRIRGKWALYYESGAIFQMLAGGTPMTVGLAILTFAAGFDSCKRYQREKARASAKRAPRKSSARTARKGGSLF